MTLVPTVIRPPSPWNEEMHEAVDALTSRIGLSILRELSTHGPRTARELMTASGISRRQTLLHTLGRLESAGVVTADIPPDQRHGRQVVYRIDADQVRWYFQQLQRLALGDEVQPGRTKA
jgi:DNA-binding HxlR family transcriptional regulator